MKKFYLFTILFFSNFLSSQTYNFDFLTKYSVQNTHKTAIHTAVNYFNSDDFSYYLVVKRNNTKLEGTLIDRERNKAHRFEVKESKVKGEVLFQFVYEYSYHLKTFNYTNYRFEFGEISNTSPKQVNLKIYNRKRAKKPIYEHQLTLKEANKNLFPLYRISMMHPFESSINLNFEGNYIVSKSNTKNGKINCEFKLEEYKNVELQINLPKKLQY